MNVHVAPTSLLAGYIGICKPVLPYKEITHQTVRTGSGLTRKPSSAVRLQYERWNPNLHSRKREENMRRLHLLLAVALVGCGGASESVVAIAPPQDAAVSDPGDGSQDATDADASCPCGPPCIYLSCETTPVGPPIGPCTSDTTPCYAPNGWFVVCCGAGMHCEQLDGSTNDYLHSVSCEPNDAGSTDAAPNDGSSDGGTTDGSSEAGHSDGGCGEHHHQEARIHHQHCHRTPAHFWRCR